jgi:hypothetical protein
MAIWPERYLKMAGGGDGRWSEVRVENCSGHPRAGLLGGIFYMRSLAATHADFVRIG